MSGAWGLGLVVWGLGHLRKGNVKHTPPTGPRTIQAMTTTSPARQPPSNTMSPPTTTSTTETTTTAPSLLQTCCDWFLQLLLPPSYRRPLVDNSRQHDHQYRELAVAEQQQQQQLASGARLEVLLPYARPPAEELHPPYPLDGTATMSVSVEALICEARMLHKPS